MRTLLGLANGFDLGTIAECVEDQADADALAEEGVDLMQGYFFGAPTIEPPWQKAPQRDAALDDDRISAVVTPLKPRKAS